MIRTLTSLLLVVASCGGGKLAGGPRGAIEAYVKAIKANNPKAGYALLSAATRRQISEAEFSERWAQLRPEVRAQADQLLAHPAESTRVTARVSYAGGTRASLRYEDGTWRIDEPISVIHDTATPADAVRALARALQRRSYEAVSRLLATSLRDRLDRDLTARTEKLIKWLKSAREVEITGDRARVRYDPRFKIELVNEDGQWKVLDYN